MFRIAIANDKGGVGKTTTAVMLATLLADKGPTLLIDADEKTASATEWAAAGPGLACTVIPVEDLLIAAQICIHKLMGQPDVPNTLPRPPELLLQR